MGKAKRVAMADLRKLVEGLGYGDVRTLLNSGNVVFTVPRAAKGDPASRIEQAMTAKLKVSARVIVLTASDLAAVVRANPLRDAEREPPRFLVMFVRGAADLRALAPLAKQDWSPEALAIGKHAAYVWCARGLIESRIIETAMKLLGDAATTRNWATVGKLLALVGRTPD